MEFGEYDNIISNYINIIKPIMNIYIDKYEKKENKNNNFINEIYFNYDMLKAFYHLGYGNMTKKDLIKLRQLNDLNKLDKIFICGCGAIHNNINYNDIIKHLRIFRHTNFINRHQEVKNFFNPIPDNDDDDEDEDPEERQYYNIGYSSDETDEEEEIIIIKKPINKINRVVYEETDNEDN